MPFRTPQEVSQNEQTYQKYVQFITPTIVNDEYLSRFEFEPEQAAADDKSRTAHHGLSVNIRFDSDVPAYSKKFKRPVEISFYLSYTYVQPEAWWFSVSKETGRRNYPDVLQKGEADAHLWYYDYESRQRIAVERVGPPGPLLQFVETFKSHLQSDLSFDGGGGPPPQAPEPQPGDGMPIPVGEEEPALAWVKANCKFARSSCVSPR